MFTHPGKKLNFMGNELARTREWDEKIDLDWEALQSPVHAGFQAYFRRLNDVYMKNPALWENDYERSSFRWISKAEGGDAVLAFTRSAGGQDLLAILNFSGKEACFANGLADKASLLLDTHEKEKIEYSGGGVCLMPYEGMLLEVN